MFKFIRIYFHLWKRHQIPMRASALTYTFILGLVPALAVCLSAFTLVFDIRQLSVDFKQFLLKQLAAGAGSIVSQHLDNFLNHVRFRTIGYVGFAALLVTALLLLSSIEDSINRIWSNHKKKKIWKRVIIYNVILFFGPVTVSLSVATTTLVSKFFPDLLTKANVGVTLITTLFVTLTYKIFPNEKVKWINAFIAGAVVAVVMELSKRGYAFYTAKAIFYNKVYGGLAVLPLFLIWVYLNWVIFLAGALLSFMLQHKKAFKSRSAS